MRQSPSGSGGRGSGGPKGQTLTGEECLVKFKEFLGMLELVTDGGSQ